MFCKAPFSGVTIDPAGWVTLCCNTNDRHYFKANINEIDSIKDVFYSEQYEEIRKTISTKGFESVPQCQVCTNALKGGYRAEYMSYDSRIKSVNPLKLRYLEFTASNICNQTCVTCGSYFSSKWLKLEQKYDLGLGGHNPPFFLSKDSVHKILEILDDLEILQIKGGEPTADKNNLKILRKLAEVNPDCRVIIISNFSEISKEWWEVLPSFKNLEMSASIDGVDKVYEWIRGASWEKTWDNMLKFKETIKLPLNINPCISLYNLFHLDVLSERLHQEFTNINFSNVVINPDHLTPHLLRDRLIPMLEDFYGLDFREKIYAQPSLYTPPPNFYFYINEEYPIEILYRRFEHTTKTMNKVREFDIFDHQPQLRDIFK